MSSANLSIPPGTPSPPPEAATPALAQTSATYWEILRRRFTRPLTTKIALTFVLLVVLCATFVPFIANASPYRVELRIGDGWQARYPLWANLTNIDGIVLMAFGACVFFVWVNRRLRRVPPEDRGRKQLTWLLGIGLALGAGATLLLMTHQNRLDPHDYRQMLQEGAARNGWFAPIPWGYSTQEPLSADLINKPPSARHLMGTDLVGRDTLARLLWSTRIVLGIGLIAEIIAVCIGLIYGSLMGYFVGWVDILGMRFVEMVEAIPTLFLIIIFVAIFGRQLALIMVIIGLTGWTGVARYVRAEFLRIRQTEYVQAAVASGLPLRSILFRHIMPNALSSVLVVITFGVASAVTSESTLSFLGLGLEPPTPSWGVMLNEAGNPGEVFRPWLALGPGFMIFLTIFACNIIGESLRDALDPRINKLE